jgi:hypothetical protein
MRNAFTRFFSEKNRELFLDKEQCVVLVCSVSCHNKLIKTEKVVVDKAGKKWSNDNPNPTKTSEVLLLAWLTTEGNYAAYRGACGGGETKLAQLQELSERIIKAGSCAGKPNNERSWWVSSAALKVTIAVIPMMMMHLT